MSFFYHQHFASEMVNKPNFPHMASMLAEGGYRPCGCSGWLLETVAANQSRSLRPERAAQARVALRAVTQNPSGVGPLRIVCPSPLLWQLITLGFFLFRTMGVHDIVNVVRLS